MTPFWQIVFGITLMGLGGGLVGITGMPLWRRRREVAGQLSELVKLVTPAPVPVPESEPSRTVSSGLAETEAIPVLPELVKESRKREQRLQRGVTGLTIPMHQGVGNVHFERWAANIANNIYLRCSDDRHGDVRGFIKKELASNYTRVEQANRLTPFGWIKVLVHDAMFEKIRFNSSLKPDELGEDLSERVREYARAFLDETLWPQFNPKLQVFKREGLGRTQYDLLFQPALTAEPGVPPICDGAVSFAPVGGKVAAPLDAVDHFRVAEERLPAQEYLPLSENLSEEVIVGPHSWCHIQTDRTLFAGTLTLAWRKSTDIGIAGELTLVEYEGADPLAVEINGYRPAILERAGDLIKVPQSEGARTTALLVRMCEGGPVTVGKVTLANTLREVRGLPEAVGFKDLNTAVRNREDFVRFLAAQIYLASRSVPEKERVVFLEDGSGRAFLSGKGWLASDRITPAGRLDRDARLCFRVKMVVSTGLRKRIGEWFGNVFPTQVMVAEVVKVFEQEDLYRDLFEEKARRKLLPDETVPGLSIEIHEDQLIPPGTLLLRALPLLVSDRRREIFGEIRLDGWDNARDISGMSCNDKRNFLIQYPYHTIKMRLSRFPLYGIHAPQVHGVIEVALEYPGQADARLMVANRCHTSVLLGKKAVPSGEDDFLAVPYGKEHKVRLGLDGQHLDIHIYDHAVEALKEREFIPAPGKLSFYGLTLGRRADVTQWATSPFGRLLDRAASGRDIEVKGVCLATPEGWLASVVRDSMREEIHYFCKDNAAIKGDANDYEIKIGEGHSTLDFSPLPHDATIEQKGPVVRYRRPRFHEDPPKIANEDILCEDYYHKWFDAIMGSMPEGGSVSHVDLLRCFPDRAHDLERHLYLVLDEGHGTNRKSGWLFRPRAGIKRIFVDSRSKPLDLPCDGPLVGPLDVKRAYWVDWEGEEKTPLSFDVPSHRAQVETYLETGFFSLEKGGFYQPGGNLSSVPLPFAGADDMYIINNRLRFTYHREATNPKTQMGFDPRAFANYFDKDSFKIQYDSGLQSFIVTSELHPKNGITPKTVFLIVGSGRPILGSHALQRVEIPYGENFLVFPGLTFKFTQGPVYYGFNT